MYFESESTRTHLCPSCLRVLDPADLDFDAHFRYSCGSCGTRQNALWTLNPELPLQTP